MSGLVRPKAFNIKNGELVFTLPFSSRPKQTQVVPVFAVSNMQTDLKLEINPV